MDRPKVDVSAGIVKPDTERMRKMLGELNGIPVMEAFVTAVSGMVAIAISMGMGPKDVKGAVVELINKIAEAQGIDPDQSFGMEVVVDAVKMLHGTPEEQARIEAEAREHLARREAELRSAQPQSTEDVRALLDAEKTDPRLAATLRAFAGQKKIVH